MTTNYGYANQGSSHRAKKERKLSVLFRRTTDQHSGGLESVAVSEDNDRLFTASRDTTVRCWEIDGPEIGKCRATYFGHSNWVNDVVLVDDMLVSCSSDYTIHLWDAHAEGLVRPVDTLNTHTDYVTCLAACPQQQKVVSGGLRGQVSIWDLESKAELSTKVFGETYTERNSPHGSVYALDINPTGTILAVGSPEGAIRLTDPRSPPKPNLMRGHSDNIRSIVLSEDGRLCLSASSDKTIRFWDTGMQRCIQTLAVHTDSVWSLATSNFQSVISGGRDCCIYKTQLTSRSSELLIKEKGPVLSLALGGDNTLWTATSQSSAHCWELPFQEGNITNTGPPPTSPRTPSKTSSGKTFYASPSPQMRLRQSRHSSGHDLDPPAKRPKLEIPGLPPLIKCSVLQDRRHVLTQDTTGKCSVWDVTSGLEEDLPFQTDDFGEAEAKSFMPHMSVAPWFTPDVKMGSLCIQLENPSCFAAELYASEIGFEDFSGMMKCNYGANFLKAVLERWIEGLSYRFVASGSANGANASDLASKSCFQLQCEPCPLIIGQEHTNRLNLPFIKAIDELDGSEKNEIVPQWISDAVLKAKFPEPAELKLSFLVLPADGSGLPSLEQSKLTAPRILKMKKISDYIIEHLDKEENLIFQDHEVYLDPAQTEIAQKLRAQLEEESKEEIKLLEIICNGKAVPFDFSVGAIKQYIWKRSDAPELRYRVFNPSKPAPLPEIKPPAQSS